jgi:hypothetical protein
LFQERIWLPLALTDPATDTQSAITMTAVTFILVILAVGAVVSIAIFIGEANLHIQKQGHSITKQERTFIV